ncbi:MAG: hypothetical protein ACTSYZ_06380 [Candidatus Helarchaeota archaeon]
MNISYIPLIINREKNSNEKNNWENYIEWLARFSNLIILIIVIYFAVEIGFKFILDGNENEYQLKIFIFWSKCLLIILFILFTFIIIYKLNDKDKKGRGIENNNQLYGLNINLN